MAPSPKTKTDTHPANENPKLWAIARHLKQKFKAEYQSKNTRELMLADSHLEKYVEQKLIEAREHKSLETLCLNPIHLCTEEILQRLLALLEQHKQLHTFILATSLHRPNLMLETQIKDILKKIRINSTLCRLDLSGIHNLLDLDHIIRNIGDVFVGEQEANARPKNRSITQLYFPEKDDREERFMRTNRERCAYYSWIAANLTNHHPHYDALRADLINCLRAGVSIHTKFWRLNSTTQQYVEQTLLHVAIEMHDEAWVEKLLNEYHANPMLENSNGQNACDLLLALARNNNLFQLIQFLLQNMQIRSMTERELLHRSVSNNGQVYFQQNQHYFYYQQQLQAAFQQNQHHFHYQQWWKTAAAPYSAPMTPGYQAPYQFGVCQPYYPLPTTYYPHGGNNTPQHSILSYPPHPTSPTHTVPVESTALVIQNTCNTLPTTTTTDSVPDDFLRTLSLGIRRQLFEPKTLITMLRALRYKLKAACHLMPPAQYQTVLQLPPSRSLMVLKRRHPDVPNPEFAKLFIALGNLTRQYAAYDEALTHYNRGLGIYLEHFEAKKSKVSKTIMLICKIVGQLGNQTLRRKLLELAIEIDASLYGADHLVVAEKKHTLSKVYGAIGQPSQQTWLLGNAIQVMLPAFGPKHLVIADLYTDLAQALNRLGQTLLSRTYLERARRIQQENHNPQDHTLIRIQTQLGIVYGVEGKLSPAIKLLETARLALLKISSDGIPSTLKSTLVETFVFLALAYYLKGRERRSTVILQQSLELASERPWRQVPQRQLQLLSLKQQPKSEDVSPTSIQNSFRGELQSQQRIMAYYASQLPNRAPVLFRQIQQSIDRIRRELNQPEDTPAVHTASFTISTPVKEEKAAYSMPLLKNKPKDPSPMLWIPTKEIAISLISHLEEKDDLIYYAFIKTLLARYLLLLFPGSKALKEHDTYHVKPDTTFVKRLFLTIKHESTSNNGRAHYQKESLKEKEKRGNKKIIRLKETSKTANSHALIKEESDDDSSDDIVLTPQENEIIEIEECFYAKHSRNRYEKKSQQKSKAPPQRFKNTKAYTITDFSEDKNSTTSLATRKQLLQNLVSKLNDIAKCRDQKSVVEIEKDIIFSEFIKRQYHLLRLWSKESRASTRNNIKFYLTPSKLSTLLKKEMQRSDASKKTPDKTSKHTHKTHNCEYAQTQQTLILIRNVPSTAAPRKGYYYPPMHKQTSYEIRTIRTNVTDSKQGTLLKSSTATSTGIPQATLEEMAAVLKESMSRETSTKKDEWKGPITEEEKQTDAHNQPESFHVDTDTFTRDYAESVSRENPTRSELRQRLNTLLNQSRLHEDICVGPGPCDNQDDINVVPLHGMAHQMGVSREEFFNRAASLRFLEGLSLEYCPFWETHQETKKNNHDEPSFNQYIIEYKISILRQLETKQVYLTEKQLTYQSVKNALDLHELNAKRSLWRSSMSSLKWDLSKHLNSLGGFSYSDSEWFEILCSKLLSSPPAMALASQYIIRRNIGLRKYLASLDKIILNDSERKACRDHPDFMLGAVVKASKISLTFLSRKSSHCSSVLNYLAYLSSEKIPTIWLSELIPQDHVNETLTTLENWKFITKINSSYIEIESILQVALRTGHNKFSAQQLLHKLGSVISNNLKFFNTKDPLSWELALNLLPHIQSVVKHYRKSEGITLRCEHIFNRFERAIYGAMLGAPTNLLTLEAFEELENRHSTNYASNRTPFQTKLFRAIASIHRVACFLNQEGFCFSFYYTLHIKGSFIRDPTPEALQNQYFKKKFKANEFDSEGLLKSQVDEANLLNNHHFSFQSFNAQNQPMSTLVDKEKELIKDGIFRIRSHPKMEDKLKVLAKLLYIKGAFCVTTLGGFLDENQKPIPLKNFPQNFLVSATIALKGVKQTAVLCFSSACNLFRELYGSTHPYHDEAMTTCKRTQAMSDLIDLVPIVEPDKPKSIFSFSPFNHMPSSFGPDYTFPSINFTKEQKKALAKSLSEAVSAINKLSTHRHTTQFPPNNKKKLRREQKTLQKKLFESPYYLYRSTNNDSNVPDPQKSLTLTFSYNSAQNKNRFNTTQPTRIKPYKASIMRSPGGFKHNRRSQ